MLHRIEIILAFNIDQWQITANVNNNPAIVKGTKIHADFNLDSVNTIKITFQGKDATVNPLMYAEFRTMYFDYIDVTPILKSGTYYTTHSDYPCITPCTDINLNGDWYMEFTDQIIRQQLTNYLGIKNVQ